MLLRGAATGERIDYLVLTYLHVERQKLSVSAVSLDEEAVALVQFQRGYEASARFIRVIDEMTQVVMSIGA